MLSNYVFNSNLSLSLCLIMFIYSCAAALDFSNNPKSWFLDVSCSRWFLKCPWNDQLMFSLIKTASSVPKAGKLRKWAPHLVNELSFYSLGQNYQPTSNLLYITDEICPSCSFGKFQKWPFEALGRCVNNEEVPKFFFNTTILCSALGNIRRLLHLCKQTDLLALCLGSRSS